MKVIEEKVDALEAALGRVTWEKHFDIYRTDFRFGSKQCTFGVNWAAIGTVSPEETKAFAKNLIWAANIVEGLNGLKIETVYNDEPMITKEEYLQCREMLYNHLEEGDIKGIADMLA